MRGLMKRWTVLGLVAGGLGAFIVGAVCLYLPRHVGGPTTLDAPVRLAATSGGRIGPNDLAGNPYLLFFGYTRCPDICPTALADLSAVLTDLKRSDRSIRAFFVSVDPERDTLSGLADFLSSFGGDVVGLKGTADEIAALARPLHVHYRRVPQRHGDYTMDHSALVYLIDRQHHLVGALPIQDRQQALNMLNQVADAVGLAALHDRPN